jgi:ATP-dependent DNA helicase RecG
VGSNKIDAALREPADVVGHALARLSEDQWFDRKSILAKPKDLARHLIAFANAEGGILVVGIHDGTVQGVADYPSTVSALRQGPLDFTNPPVRASFEEVACVDEKGRSNSLLVIRVEPGERVHEARDGECYLRVGDESRKLTYNQRRELEYDRGQSQYDGLAAGVDFSHLDARLLGQYGRRIGLSANPKRALAARSLLTIDSQLTNAGYLLFGKRPQDLFPQAHVRVLKFLTAERGTGSRLGLEDSSDIRIDGPIPYVVEQATKVVDDLVPRRRSLTASGRFEAVQVVPRDVWLEGLVNAVIHRSYSLAGDHIRVEIYPNRIEIESPGRFPGLVDPRYPLNISRFARNPRIARVCADLRIGQELGEGIRRMFEEMRLAGLTDPVYRQTAGSVRLVLAGLPRLEPALAARLPAGSQQVLDTLRAAAIPLGTGELAEVLGLSRPTVLRKLRALERAGLVRWVGKAQTDPRAAWVLADHR